MHSAQGTGPVDVVDWEDGVWRAGVLPLAGIQGEGRALTAGANSVSTYRGQSWMGSRGQNAGLGLSEGLASSCSLFLLSVPPPFMSSWTCCG
jgi:hypothetical protein